MQRVVVLGFDHGPHDRRIQKDLDFLSESYEVIYIFRGDINESTHFKNKIRRISLSPDLSKNRFLRRFDFEKRMVDLALSVSPDIFYLHSMFLTAPTSFLKTLRKRAKIIYDAHEYDLEPIFVRNDFLRWTLSCALRVRQNSISKQIDACFTVSPSIKKFLDGEGYQNVHLKLNVSDSEVKSPLKRAKRKNIIVMAGNVSRERGALEFLELFRKMVNGKPDLELHFYCNVSEKQFEKQLLRKVSSLSLQNNVMFFKVLPYMDLIEVLSTSLAAVMAFPIEKGLTNKIAMPNRFFDSIAAGTPVIASLKAIDLAEVINKEHLGWLVDYNRPDEGASLFLETIDNAHAYDKMLNQVNLFAKKNNKSSIHNVLRKVF